MRIRATVFFWLATAMAGSAAERAAAYPFDVTVAGETAAVEGDPEHAIFAKLKKPVAKDALVELDAEPGQIIVNVFPSNAKGEPKPGAAPAVILVEKGTSFQLDKTMDQSVLKDGTYAMNVVMPSKGTSRVLFEVGSAKPSGDAQKSPEALLRRVFEIARDGDLSELKVFMPPGGGEDGDVRRIGAVSEAPEKDQTEFRAYFRTGKIVGEPRIDEKAGTAQVDFLFGPKGTKDETMNLIRKGGLWYLSDF